MTKNKRNEKGVIINTASVAGDVNMQAKATNQRGEISVMTAEFVLAKGHLMCPRSLNSLKVDFD